MNKINNKIFIACLLAFISSAASAKGTADVLAPVRDKLLELTQGSLGEIFLILATTTCIVNLLGGGKWVVTFGAGFVAIVVGYGYDILMGLSTLSAEVSSSQVLPENATYIEIRDVVTIIALVVIVIFHHIKMKRKDKEIAHLKNQLNGMGRGPEKGITEIKDKLN